MLRVRAARLSCAAPVAVLEHAAHGRRPRGDVPRYDADHRRARRVLRDPPYADVHAMVQAEPEGLPGGGHRVARRLRPLLPPPPEEGPPGSGGPPDVRPSPARFGDREDPQRGELRRGEELRGP